VHTHNLKFTYKWTRSSVNQDSLVPIVSSNLKKPTNNDCLTFSLSLYIVLFKAKVSKLNSVYRHIVRLKPISV